MKNIFKWKKEKSKTLTDQRPTSSFSPLDNLINRPRPTLKDISTVRENVNDVIVSTSSLSGKNPSSSIVAVTSTLEHAPLNKKEQSRMTKTVTVGQEDTFKEVCDFLKETEVGIIGIYGMGGVGKTTLMKKVCYEFMKPSNFKIIWIVVSRKVNEENIQQSIMRELNLSCNEYEPLQNRAMKINEALYNNYEGSQIALVLDDIWDAIDLDELGLAGGLGLDASMIKIIFTTRSKDVCLRMNPDQMVKINCLGLDESWVLFDKIVGRKTLYSHGRILDLAKEVANECGGLPLALTVIGKAMVCKTSVGAWEDALNNLRIRPSLLSGSERNLYERLKFSYENLENQVERDCFLFCCIYPEDKEIDVSTLIECWIGEGLLDVSSYNTYQEICNRGNSIVDTLVAKSLLEEVVYFKPRVKIHDVIRDMGLWIGSRENLFVHISDLNLRGKDIEVLFNGGRWAYIYGSIQELCCSDLSVLHMDGKSKKTTKLSSPFFTSLRFMHKLKVLILRFVEWECLEIPPSTIGLLVELRHLEISCLGLIKLPSDIGNLAKLLVLILLNNDEHLRLPTTIGDLCELRKLKIEAWLTKIPPELEKLKKLEIIEIYVVYTVGLFGIFNHLTKLRQLVLYCHRLRLDLLCLNKLEELLLSIQETVDDPPLMKDFVQLPSLKFLSMIDWPIVNGDEMITTLNNMSQLRELRIRYSPLENFVIPVTSHELLSQLKLLSFEGCNRLQKIRFGERALHSLDDLSIAYCPFLESIVGLQHLQQLRRLHIGFTGDECVEESLAASDVEHCLLPDLAGVCMPNLQYLSVFSMKKMKRICSEEAVFPLLSEFILNDCPVLEKLPRGLMNKSRSLRGGIKGTIEWWEGLQWEDDDFKSYLFPILHTDGSSFHFAPPIMFPSTS